MRRAIPIITGVILVLALVPAAHATTGELVITSDRTLTEDHFGNIVIAADNVTLDCAGFRVVGPGTLGTYGVLVEGRTGVVVTNCDVQGFEMGIRLHSSTGSRVIGNTASGSHDSGFMVEGGSNDVLTGNTASGNHISGFLIYGSSSSGPSLIGNLASGNTSAGFELYGSRSSTLQANVARDNETGFYLDGSAGNALKENVAEHNGWGFYLHLSDSNVLTENLARGNSLGFYIYDESIANRLEANTATQNEGWGFLVETDTFANVLVANVATDNGGGGLGIGYSFGTVVEANRTDRNGGWGIAIGLSHDTTLIGNVATSNAVGGISVAGSVGVIFQNRAMLNNRVEQRPDGGGIIVRASFFDISRNVACKNGNLDAYDDHTGQGNRWKLNNFCRSAI